MYPRRILKEESFLLSPYGGLIYVKVNEVNKFGDFDITFENVIESPRFVFGVDTNEGWGLRYPFPPWGATHNTIVLYQQDFRDRMPTKLKGKTWWTWASI